MKISTKTKNAAHNVSQDDDVITELFQPGTGITYLDIHLDKPVDHYGINPYNDQFDLMEDADDSVVQSLSASDSLVSLIKAMLKADRAGSRVEVLIDGANIGANRPLVTPKPLPIPGQVPDYQGKRADGEAIDFIAEHFKRWLDGVSMSRADLRRLQPKLAARLDWWVCQDEKNKIPGNWFKPTEWVDRTHTHPDSPRLLSAREYERRRKAAQRAQKRKQKNF